MQARDAAQAHVAAAGGQQLPVKGAVVVAERDFSRRDGETRKEYLQREFSALKPFAIISVSYLLYTITDGAVRMIVLLRAYQLKFTAWEVRSPPIHPATESGISLMG